MDTTTPKIIDKTWGKGVHTKTDLVRADRKAKVHISRYSYRYPWTADYYVAIPESRNRQAPGIPMAINGTRRAEVAHGQVGRGFATRDEAIKAALDALTNWDHDAKMAELIEEAWERDYRAQCLDYLKLNDAKWFERIEAIRRVRQLDAGFAELFPEPPVRE